MPEFPVPINQPFKNIFFEKKDYLSTYDKSFNEKFKNHFAQETLGHFVDNIEQHCVHGYGIIMTRRILKNDQHGFEIRVIEDGDNLGGRLPSEEIKIGVTRKMGGEGGYGLARIKERVKEMFIFSKRENDNALFWSSYYPHQNFVVEDFPINIGRITIVRF